MAPRSRREFEQKARRLESLLHALGELEEEGARRSALDAVRALLDLHRDVLARMLELAGPEICRVLAEDEVVSGLLLLHGVHPLTVDERVAGALDQVRPYMSSHGGGVELLHVRDGVVRLRLEGSCHGCPSSQATMRHAVEGAIAERAPDVIRVEVEGEVQPPAGAGFVALGAIGGRRAGATRVEVEGLQDLRPDTVLGREVAGARVAFCRIGDSWYAYRDRCPGCEAPLSDAALAEAVLTCAGCGRRFDARKAGRGLDGDPRHLEPLPLIVEGGRVRVTVPEVRVGAA